MSHRHQRIPHDATTGERSSGTRARDHRCCAVHGRARQPRGDDRAAEHPEDLGASLEQLEWMVNAYTLTFAVLLLTGAALGDRFGRRRIFRSVSRSSRSPRRRRALARAGDADRRPGAAGRRRGDRDAAEPDDPHGGRPAERRGVALGIWGGHRRARRRARPARRRRRRRRHLLALDLLAERADRPRAVPLALPPPAREPRPGRRARPAGLALAQRRPVRDRLRPRARQRRAAGPARTSSALIVGGVAAARAFVWWERATPSADAADAASSATARSPPRTSCRSRCPSGCSGRSSCSPSSSRPCRATRPFEAGLRTLPWTLMPMFVAPVAGALSDRIGGRPLMAPAWRCSRSRSAGSR